MAEVRRGRGQLGRNTTNLRFISIVKCKAHSRLECAAVHRDPSSIMPAVLRQEGRLVKSAHTVWVIDCFVSERVFNLWEVRPSRTPSVLHGVEPLPAVCLPLLPCLGADLSSMRCFGCLDYRRDGKTKAKCHPKQKA